MFGISFIRWRIEFLRYMQKMHKDFTIKLLELENMKHERDLNKKRYELLCKYYDSKK